MTTTLELKPQVTTDAVPGVSGAVSRHNNFDAIRLLMAIAVILAHSYALTGLTEREPLSVLTRGGAGSGGIAVAVFFVISGYLITKSWAGNPDVARYAKKRAARIVPGYVVAAACSIVLVACVFGPAAARPMLLASILGEPMQSARAFANNPFPNFVNGSLWTIRYEVYCYVAVAILGMLGLNRREWPLLVIAVVCWAIAVADARWSVLPTRYVFGLGSLPHLCSFGSYFAWGAACWVTRRYLPHSAWMASAALVSMVLLMRLGRLSLTAIATPPLLCIAVFGIAFDRRINGRGWTRFGDLSYGTYLYAFPVQQMIAHSFPRVGPLAMFTVTTPASLAIAWCSWRWIESPFLRKAHGRRTSAQPTDGSPVW